MMYTCLGWSNTSFLLHYHPVSFLLRKFVETPAMQIKGFQKKQSCGRFSDHFICSITVLSYLCFCVTECNVLTVFRLLLQRYVRSEEVTMQRTQQFSDMGRNHLNSAHAQLVWKLRLLLYNLADFKRSSRWISKKFGYKNSSDIT